MKKVCLLLCFTVLASICTSQKYDYNWVMGYDSHLGFPDIEGVFLDFNQIPVSVNYAPVPIWMRTSLGCISDSSGQLLFYTNGCSILNVDNEIIENGSGLNPGAISDDLCGVGYPGGRQSCLILPGSQPLEFYLFHKGIYYEEGTSSYGGSNPLYYSLIDMSLNEGKGRVIEKNIPIIEDNITYGQLTAVKHANGHDWWVITGGDSNNTYYRILLSDGMLQSFEIQNIGLPSSYHGSRGGQANFSPDGTKYIRYSNPDGIFLFDFDQATGLLSNFLHLPTPEETFADGIGVSPNSRYMYITTDNHVFQYDLHVSNIADSQIQVAEYDGYTSPFATRFAQIELAPDCKLYINTFATVDVLHVIHNPDEPGIACNVEQHAVQLPFNYSRALPHFPNYRLGPLIPGETPAPPCSPIVRTEEPLPAPEPAIKVFPNPASAQLTLSIETPANGEWQLFHADGRLALRQLLQAGKPTYEIDVALLPPGMYFYRVFLEGQPAGNGKVSVVR